MVRAILDGRKTQTRRIVKVQSTELIRANGAHWPAYKFQANEGTCGSWYYRDPEDWSAHDVQYKLLKPQPYKVGDQLWVRETFMEVCDWNTLEPLGKYIYRATHEGHEPVQLDEDGFHAWNKDGTAKSPWQPSIHMPLEASRITLEVTNVRAERLQDFSWLDAIAEGIKDPKVAALRIDDEVGTVQKFRKLWDSIYSKKHPWDSNPWVWVYEFKLLEVKR